MQAPADTNNIFDLEDGYRNLLIQHLQEMGMDIANINLNLGPRAGDLLWFVKDCMPSMQHGWERVLTMLNLGDEPCRLLGRNKKRASCTYIYTQIYPYIHMNISLKSPTPILQRLCVIVPSAYLAHSI